METPNIHPPMDPFPLEISFPTLKPKAEAILVGGSFLMMGPMRLVFEGRTSGCPIEVGEKIPHLLGFSRRELVVEPVNLI